jgi:GH25 family lysozyme M1 (1,4-beta-N-acetylmuramidase)
MIVTLMCCIAVCSSLIIDCSASNLVGNSLPQSIINTTQQEVLSTGIDVSYWQGDIDFNKVKNSGIDYVMIRAGYGKSSNQVDLRFEENIKKAKDAGLNVGVYWFSYALTPEDAKSEAYACLNVIKDYKLEYPVVYDFETKEQMLLSKDSICSIVDAFCSTIENNGYFATIYTYEWLANDNFTKEVDYDVWLTNVKKPFVSFRNNIGMWQYSISGKVEGILTSVDMNYCYRDYPEIMSRKHLNGY